MKKDIICILILGGSWQTAFCQNIPGVENPCTTSSQGAAGNFIISYTIGEMPLVQSWQSNGLLITQGTIQPLTFIADSAYQCFSQTEVKVYPNPNPGIFSLQLSLLKKGKAKTILFDAAGKLLQTDEFDYTTFTTKQFNINRFASGVFYLQLFFTETGSSNLKKCVYTIQKIQ
ncbi:T9SS type A sorting domain-containing protein [Ferruginibacter sp.]|nr:T9SS type A sorting domain-containing protein [Ferruginibacter sp.]